MKEKRTLRRPWGRKLRGGWIIQPDELLTALKEGDIAEIGKLRVGAKQLRELIRLMEFPEQEFLVSTNGCLEVSNIQRYIRSRNGSRRTEFRKPKREHSFRVQNGAWVPNGKKPKITLVIKPRKYG